MQHFATGLMSGTSLDGVDLAHCVFEEKEGKWAYRLLHAETIPYPADWKTRLREAPTLAGSEMVQLHNEYGRFLGRALQAFFKKFEIGSKGIIASHGHTVFHRPDLGYTWQIGSGAAIAAETGSTVVCDFRSLDVALQGQGAPLVPVGDQLLFGDYPYCLNLGGFANISFDRNGTRQAFDICPVNFVMNRLVARADASSADGGGADDNGPNDGSGADAAGPGYDPGGTIAESGKTNLPLLEKLNNLAFYSQSGPKSLGEEWVNRHVMPLLNQSNLPLQDLLSTWVEHTAIMVSRAISPGEKGRVLVTGGGAHNTYLIQRIRARLPEKTDLHVPDRLTVDFKEALVFAFLGVLRMLGRNNCLAPVTGSRKDHSGGCVFNPGETFGN
jgi:anhydro-N-acetylmuramic acid kinase